jgi:aminoglycoside 2'-N-acetyltransferase I
MNTPGFTITIRPGDSLSQSEYKEILDLCTQVFEEDYAPYLKTFREPVHVLGSLDEVLVSHALWITRWIQIGEGPLLRTAYVEGVVTEEKYRRRGYASRVMGALAVQIQGYDIGGLSPAEPNLYARLGWEYWQGPLYARKGEIKLLVPGEAAMILRTPKTPPLDLTAPASIEWREGDVW